MNLLSSSSNPSWYLPLLGTTLKGFMEIKKVDILWNDGSKASKSNHGFSGELYLSVTMSNDSGSGKFWGVLQNRCQEIRHMIDWTRRHPDSIYHFCSAFGIEAGRQYFLHSLASAISGTGKKNLPKHLGLVADSLAANGEIVGWNATGFSRQRKNAPVSSPFVQACFTSPGSCFVKAAKSGVMDNLGGCIDALAWGNCPSMGTSGQFDLMYSNKELELATSVDVYNLLSRSQLPNCNTLNEKIDDLDAQKDLSN